MLGNIKNTPELNKRVEIEKARVEDAEEIVEVRRQGWMTTYPNPALGISEEDIRLRIEGKNGEIIARAVEKWRKGIETEGATRTTFVAKENGKILGCVSPGRLGGQQRVGALYVLPEAQGRGVGSQLLKHAIDWMGRDEDIYLHVVSYNQRAIEFYKKFGFVENGEIEDDGLANQDVVALPEIEMVLRAEATSN